MDIIILAAGLSTRMKGTQKLLLPWKDTPVITHCTKEALAACCEHDHVVVVTGCDSLRVRQALAPLAEDRRLILADNPDYEKGQFSSTLTGLEAIDGTSPFFITMGDLPLITSEHYLKLLPLLAEHDAVRPTCNGVPGHPVLHAPSLRAELLAPTSHYKTMRQFLATKKTYAPDDGDNAWISDIDTPKAYEELLHQQLHAKPGTQLQ